MLGGRGGLSPVTAIFSVLTRQRIGLTLPVVTPFDQCFAFVILREGGFSNNPKDPGGVTGAGGVTLSAVRLRDHDKDGRLDFDLDRDGVVTEADMRALRADSPEVRELYLDDYWTPARCDDMPTTLKLPVFDCAINSGPRTAIALLQKALGVQADGVVGPHTIVAAHDPEAIERYMAERAVFYARQEMRQHLAVGEASAFVAGTRAPVFLRGWSRRLAAVQTAALRMI